jgi:hypothetical protein
MATLASNKDFSTLPGLSTGHTTNADNPFEPFFGPISVQDGQNVKAGDTFSHETYNLPDAYKGKSLFMEDIMDWLITRTDEWYTSRVMPWRMTDQLSVKWNVWRFNRTMADLEPHQGVPRYVTAESEERSDRLVRRGLAFIIEHGFWTTDRGRKHYLTNLEQITSAVHETAYYGVLHALLSGKNHWKEWNRQYGRRVTRIDDLLRMDRNRWAICQKTPRGMFLLDAQLREMLSHQGVTADTWILPSKVGVYLNMVPSNVTSVEEAGPSKQISDNNSNTAAMQKLTTFRGSVVCETRPFDMDFSGEPVELLRREKMIGEYYTMLAHDSPSSQQYKTDHRSIYIYNCDVDRFEKVQITDAIDNCFRFSKTGGMPDGDHEYIKRGYGNSGARDVSTHDDPMMCHHDNELEKAPDGVCTWLGDLPLEHFRDSDIRDWADTVKRACRNSTGNTASPQDCNTFLRNILGADYDPNCIAINAAFGVADAATPIDPDVYRAFNVPTAIEPLVSALQDSWDPSLAHSVLGAGHPQMAYVPQLETSQIAQRFHSGFPEMWKSHVNAGDFQEVRSAVVGEFKAAGSDDERLGVLKRANALYEKSLTDKAVSRRSKLADGGVLDRALMELQAPSSKKARSTALKETRAFLDKFASSVAYFQQLDSTRTVEAQGLLEEIVRDFIQPLNAVDASQMEKRIEAHIDAGDALTPQLLAQWKTEVSKNSIDTNIERLARNLKPAGYKAPDTADAGLDRATFRSNRNTFRRTAENAYGLGAGALAGGADGGGAFPAVGNRSREMRQRLRRVVDRAGAMAPQNQNDMFKCMFCHCRLTKNTLNKFAEYDILIPFGFLLVRPFMRYDMCSGILCKSGSDLGQTFMGHADFQLTDDVIHKVHVGHYTFYSKSVVHNDKLYTIAEDIFAAGYKGGEGTRFYKSKEDLSADIHAEAFRASIIAHMIPYRTNQPNAPRIQNPIDITGKLHPTLYQDTDIPEVEADVAMYPGARYLAEKLELRSMTSYTSDATEHFLSPFKYLNTIAFQGPQYYFSNITGQFARIQGQGHFGDNAYPGCKGVRCGDMDYFREVQHSDESPI